MTTFDVEPRSISPKGRQVLQSLYRGAARSKLSSLARYVNSPSKSVSFSRDDLVDSIQRAAATHLRIVSLLVGYATSGAVALSEFKGFGIIPGHNYKSDAATANSKFALKNTRNRRDWCHPLFQIMFAVYLQRAQAGES